MLLILLWGAAHLSIKRGSNARLRKFMLIRYLPLLFYTCAIHRQIANKSWPMKRSSSLSFYFALGVHIFQLEEVQIDLKTFMDSFKTFLTC